MDEIRSREPDSARALLDAMRAATETRGEPALWEPWANAAFNLMNDLRSRDPDAARVFIEGLSPDDLKRLKLVIEQATGRAPQS